MAMSQTTSQGKLLALIKQDPKKAGALAVLLLVLLGLWGRMALSGGGPKTAAAMPAATPAQAPSPASNNVPRNTDEAALLREWVSEPLPDSISRNVFDLKLDYYPMDAARVAPDTRTIDDPTFWERLAKSIDAQADQQHKRETLIQNLRQQAGQLQLTSTVMGPRPKAMVNGRMVGEGEVVAQFRVLKIEARSVIVEREGIKLEIPMK
jgi:hypothetical protein